MPCLKIFTNLAKNKIPENFISKVIPVLSRTVKKPENKFVVVMSADCSVSFYGSNNSSAVVSLESIGNLGLEENKIITKEITDIFHKELGIAPENLLITYYDLKGMNVATGGVTRA